MGILKPIRLSGWIRATREDVDTTFDMVPEIKHLNLSISTSDQMINGKFLGKKSRESILDMAVDAVEAAITHGAEVVAVNAEDASRTDIDFLIHFATAAKEHGAARFRYCDTLGCESPFSIYESCKALAENVGIPIEVHCHGDLGMAVANSMAGAMGIIDGGQDAYINTTINGIGERAGNADLVAVILALRNAKGLPNKYECAVRVDLSKAWDICRYASYAFGIPIPINQPGVGANAFAHASGIHADGVLKDSRNYELYGYEELGRGDPVTVETGREICSGEYGGISGFSHIMGQLEVGFSSTEEAYRVLELVRYANVLSQKPLVEDELKFIAKYPDAAKELMTFTPLD
jgi:homocitrate synthase NifV